MSVSSMSDNNMNRKEEFMNSLTNIYEKCMHEGKLGFALKAQEMMAKANGYFSSSKSSGVNLEENIESLSADQLDDMIKQYKNK